VTKKICRSNGALPPGRRPSAMRHSKSHIAHSNGPTKLTRSLAPSTPTRFSVMFAITHLAVHGASITGDSAPYFIRVIST